MQFPETRLQRLRSTAQRRNLVSEYALRPSNFILPLFVHESITTPTPIETLPGVNQWPLSHVMDEVRASQAVGVNQFILFGIPESKTDCATEAYNPDGVVQKAIRLIRKEAPEAFISADCCLCEYTESGHCSVIEESKINDDKTRETLGKIAVSYAEAGADCVAPSGMIDGMVQAIRSALEMAGFSDTLVMSYAVKYASSFYGPFRDAAGSTFKGTRTHHQMNPPQAREALLEAELDTKEGADLLIVKPASTYQDIIYRVSQAHHQPVIAYHVSGEYSALKAAAKAGILDEKDAFCETAMGLIRSGATAIITYAAKELAQWSK